MKFFFAHARHEPHIVFFTGVRKPDCATEESLCGAMQIMPVSGVTMGIFGGKGIPFFGLGTVPGLDPKETGLGWVAGRAFKLHKQAGQIFEYIVPIHIGAVGVHMAKGQAILSRIL